MDTQPTSIDEVVEEFRAKFGSVFELWGHHVDNDVGSFGETEISMLEHENWLRSKLTTLVEQARLDTLQEIFVKYGFDFTDEGVKKAMSAARTISSDKK